jgi:hypothetical protein
MLPILHLDPAIEPVGAIKAVAVLGVTLQPHQAGMAKQLRTDLAGLERRGMNAGDAAGKQPRRAPNDSARRSNGVMRGNSRRADPSKPRSRSGLIACWPHMTVR